MCDSIGNLLCCQDEDGPSLLARQLDLGPSLFLMSTKALAFLFTALAIFNIPVLAFFYSGNATQSESQLSKLTLGNVGAPAIACDTTKNMVDLWK